jgi:hypothetical protein
VSPSPFQPAPLSIDEFFQSLLTALPRQFSFRAAYEEILSEGGQYSCSMIWATSFSRQRVVMASTSFAKVNASLFFIASISPG